MRIIRFAAALSLSGLITTSFLGCAVGTAAFTSTATTVATPALAVIDGNVSAGSQPVSGAHVYLLAANTTGYGQPSLSLLNASATGTSDSIGAYVLTDSSGNFALSADYTCKANAQVYVYALGGNAGSGVNAASAMMAVLGTCPTSGSFASAIPTLVVNEATTVAAAYAMSAFATDALHVSSSGTALAQVGIANAFANAANLVSISSGAALGTTPAGNGVAPRSTVNLLANVLAACITSKGASSAGCTSLFANATANGSSGNAPSETATAAINIAHNPGANVTALYTLAGTAGPFSPSLSVAPNDFLLTINYAGAGLNGPSSIAVDAEGNIWAASLANGAVAELSPVGAPVSPSTGFMGGASAPVSLAIDLSGNVWVADAVTSSVTEYSSSGAVISPKPLGYTGGGVFTPQGIAIDGRGDAWVASFTDAVAEFNSSGVPVSPPTGYTGGGLNGPGGLAIDADDAVWIPNSSSIGITGVSKFSSAGVPLSPVNGFLGGGVNLPYAIAIDGSGNAWVANLAGNSLTELNSAGTPISGSNGYTGGGLDLPFAMAIDGLGNPWVANYLSNTISEFSNNGTPISPSTGYTSGVLTSPQALAIDGSGNVWIANSNDVTITELIGAAAPVVTPISAAIKNHALGGRP